MLGVPRVRASPRKRSALIPSQRVTEESPEGHGCPALGSAPMQFSPGPELLAVDVPQHVPPAFLLPVRVPQELHELIPVPPRLRHAEPRHGRAEQRRAEPVWLRKGNESERGRTPHGTARPGMGPPLRRSAAPTSPTRPPAPNPGSR